MSVEECWTLYRLILRIPETRSTRMAFQAGARHALTELTKHSANAEDAEQIALHLNDEILAFGLATPAEP